MAEFNALQHYPEPATPRIVTGRGIKQRIIASERGHEFYDGARCNGYGGLHDDGRWKAVAAFMAQHYQLPAHGKVLQIQCDKGYLLREFERLGYQADGLDSSEYAVSQSVIRTIAVRGPLQLPSFWDHTHDLVIAIGAVYTLNLGDAVTCLREIQRVSRAHAFVTLAAYDGEDDYRLLRAWSLLGATILPRDEWREVLEHAGYTGDYAFVTAQTLGLSWA